MRGYKKIVQHLPHEVADFEPLLDLLSRQKSTDFAVSLLLLLLNFLILKFIINKIIYLRIGKHVTCYYYGYQLFV